MYRKFLKSKIHRARVTGRELFYEGSLSLDPELIRAAGLSPFEAVWVYNLSNGARFETYVIEGRAGSGEVVLNGAAARLGEIGDEVIIVAYAWVAEGEFGDLKVRLVYVDEGNRVREVKEVSPS
ncbi:aspartate 1-decarboxylase [Thermosulfurimonas dismutans]|uniref:Aspartate 1-decarboxylase n=1 Tax=Thermosulfurimonas dismutans TaxID=999894 RepID=A0A179D4J1_9BACT|nr:aspartate 1-decarboxylase [Thermosulfurimonas dismutans]OAQ21000.1 Aspartate 1-decarboxylase [Thermosulfurimonas dismutans]